MKTKTIIRIFALVIAVAFTACSGGKKETAESNQEQEKLENKGEEVVEVKIFEAVDASVKSQINNLLSNYFELNQALIEDNKDGAKASAKKLAESIQKFDMSKLAGDQMEFYHTQETKLTQSLEGINASADIEETRLELAALSEGMFALVKAYHPNESLLYYQFCPMAKNGEGAAWLSTTEEIVNPYMGQRMLKCGTTKETL